MVVKQKESTELGLAVDSQSLTAEDRQLVHETVASKTANMTGTVEKAGTVKEKVIEIEERLLKMEMQI